MNKNEAHDVGCQCDDCRKRREIEAFAAIREIHTAGTQELNVGYRRLSVPLESRTKIEQAVYDAVLPSKAENLSLKVRLMERDNVLTKGRKSGSVATKQKAAEKRGKINDAVDALFDKPQDALYVNGLTVLEATADQIAAKVKAIIGQLEYTDATFLKAVKGRVAHCRATRKSTAS